MATETVIVAANFVDKPVIRQLLELYCHDFSEFTKEEVNEHGLFGYRYLDHYWTEPDRHPFLIQVDGRLAGLALVRAGQPHDMAEFFVLRKYRRTGVGQHAAGLLFAAFPGEWQVRELSGNQEAIAFWRAVIPAPYQEDTNDKGPVQHFTSTG